MSAGVAVILVEGTSDSGPFSRYAGRRGRNAACGFAERPTPTYRVAAPAKPQAALGRYLTLPPPPARGRCTSHQAERGADAQQHERRRHRHDAPLRRRARHEALSASTMAFPAWSCSPSSPARTAPAPRRPATPPRRRGTPRCGAATTRRGTRHARAPSANRSGDSAYHSPGYSISAGGNLIADSATAANGSARCMRIRHASVDTCQSYRPTHTASPSSSGARLLGWNVTLCTQLARHRWAMQRHERQRDEHFRHAARNAIEWLHADEQHVQHGHEPRRPPRAGDGEHRQVAGAVRRDLREHAGDREQQRELRHDEGEQPARHAAAPSPRTRTRPSRRPGRTGRRSRSAPSPGRP